MPLREKTPQGILPFVNVRRYDILPLVPIIIGAGGIVTAWDGGAPTAGGRIIAAGDPRVHQAAMKVLNG